MSSLKNNKTLTERIDIAISKEGKIKDPNSHNKSFVNIFSTLSLKKDIFFNFELTHRYKKYYSQNIEKAKKLISLMK